MITEAFTAGVRIRSVRWTSPGALLVRFDTAHPDCLHHLYAGRRRVGLCGLGARQLTASLQVTDHAQSLTLVACRPAVSQRDFGPLLPPRPVNAPLIRCRAEGAGWATARTIEVESAGQVIARTVWRGDGLYRLQAPPLQSGLHVLNVQGRDGREPSGSVGTPVQIPLRVNAPPADLVSDPRFEAVAESGTLSITCEVPA